MKKRFVILFALAASVVASVASGCYVESGYGHPYYYHHYHYYRGY